MPCREGISKANQKRSKTMKTDINEYTIDAIGNLRARIADLQAQIKPLEVSLKEEGEGYYEGELFAGTVSEVLTDRVDWKAVALKLNPSRQLIAGNTKTGTSVRLTVSARSKAAA
jgi:hypothetical protein